MSDDELLGSEELAFKKIFDDLMETFKIQSEKYNTCWFDDGLDVRATFCEFAAKYQRLKNLIWVNWDKMGDEKHRARVQETLRDAILYLLFAIRRIDLQLGPVSPDLIKKLVDKS